MNVPFEIPEGWSAARHDQWYNGQIQACGATAPHEKKKGALGHRRPAHTAESTHPPP